MAHASCRRWAGPRAKGGWRPPSSLHMATMAWPGRPPPHTTTPQTPFHFLSGTHHKSSALGTVRKEWCRELGCAGVRRGHEDRAELFLLEVSRAGTITNLQAPLLKCHPPPPATAGAVSITCACYKTTARLTLRFSQKPDKAPSIPGSAAAPSLATASSAWPCQWEGRTFTFPSTEGQALCEKRFWLREGQEHSSTEVPGDVTWAAAPSGTFWRTLGESKPCSLSRAAAATGKKTASLKPEGLRCPLSSTQTKPKGRRVRRQTRRGGEAGLEGRSALAHFPARRSSWRLVRMYLKNSYTDQAIAVEGI